MMNLDEYRAQPSEHERTQSLMELVPPRGGVALDVGARDGHFSHMLAERFETVLALDLHPRPIDHPRVTCVTGDVTALGLRDQSIDFVLCAEVLEHIPEPALRRACEEIARVARGSVLLGVPYRQDLRVGRTNCVWCGAKNPPYGHVNTFDEPRLQRLFPAWQVETTKFVGTTLYSTNTVSTVLMDLAGNPYGTYTQDEPCIRCGRLLVAPPPRTLVQKVFTKMAFTAQLPTRVFASPKPSWVHMRLSRLS